MSPYETFNIPLLNVNIKKRNQFNFDQNNVLLREIMKATGFNRPDAVTCAASICKFLSFWIEANSKNLLNITFVDFFKNCIAKGYVDPKNAYVKEAYGFYDGVFDPTLARIFGMNSLGTNSYNQFIKYASANPNFIGTLRIINKKGDGRHSLISYSNDSKLFISDTSSRGIAEPFEKHINEKNFCYFTQLY